MYRWLQSQKHIYDPQNSNFYIGECADISQNLFSHPSHFCTTIILMYILKLAVYFHAQKIPYGNKYCTPTVFVYFDWFYLQCLCICMVVFVYLFDCICSVVNLYLCIYLIVFGVFVNLYLCIYLIVFDMFYLIFLQCLCICICKFIWLYLQVLMYFYLYIYLIVVGEFLFGCICICVFIWFYLQVPQQCTCPLLSPPTIPKPVPLTQ